ncbi:hypothetical protein A3F66_06865 [candidate division TM6 bacterium RIFCSPHIGHO2_12_FULL_32_22]|nr:MAG: hypothetical protein A3F66_06865 [candidate division TM6 bacterium RIFCSPHIGHO2_12_FULL_32_22]
MKKYLLTILLAVFYVNAANLRDTVAAIAGSRSAGGTITLLPDDPFNLVIQRLIDNYVTTNRYNGEDAAFIEQLIAAAIIARTAEIDRYLTTLREFTEAQREFERLTTFPEEDLIDALIESVGHESEYSTRARGTLHHFRRRFPDVDVLSLPYQEFPTLRDYLIDFGHRWGGEDNKYISRFIELYSL